MEIQTVSKVPGTSGEHIVVKVLIFTFEEGVLFEKTLMPEAKLEQQGGRGFVAGHNQRLNSL